MASNISANNIASKNGIVSVNGGRHDDGNEASVIFSIDVAHGGIAENVKIKISALTAYQRGGKMMIVS